jgi:dienelactone hydrolase
MVTHPLAILICLLSLTGTVFDDLFSFSEKEVQFDSAQDVLKGTLYMPGSSGSCPAVVLLGGAERGPRMTYKRLLAEQFAGSGIAALIYDSPGTGESEGNAMLQTKKDRIREAIAAFRFLRTQEGVQPDAVGVYGFSEGAGIALLAAAEETEVAFAIPVSGGLGVPPMEQSRYRIEMMGLEAGLAPEAVQKGLVFEEIQYALVTGIDIVEWQLIEMKIRQWPEEPWEDLVEVTKRCRDDLSDKEKQEVKEEFARVINILKTQPWFEMAVPDTRKYDWFLALDARRFFWFLKNNPFAAGDWHHNSYELQTLPRVKCPILAIWGERDRYVPWNRSMAVFKNCMAQAGHDDVTLLTIPEASHMITLPGKELEFTGGYPGVMKDWILKRFPPEMQAENQ